MPDPKKHKQALSRRAFVKGMGWVPMALLPAPLQSWLPRLGLQTAAGDAQAPLASHRFTPSYPAKSSLDEVLRLVAPGSDEFTIEGYSFEIAARLDELSHRLKESPRSGKWLAQLCNSAVQFNAFVPARQQSLRNSHGIEVVRREFSPALLSGRDQLLREIDASLATFQHLDVADLQVFECREVAGSPLTLESKVRYELAGARADRMREERIGEWAIRWTRDGSGSWQILRLTALSETVSRADGPVFIDITSHALGENDSYRQQLLHGADYWRTVLDGAVGVDVYGNNGVAVGDFDNDGFDDLYVCQPAGLPNRLYRNRGDGTFEDVTEAAGVGVLDFTACALFADFQNRGLQDLLVVCASGPLLFVNEYNGKFSLKRDAFRFAKPAQGAFTHAAAADYDRDGRLDIYFCLYNYYQGLDQYRYPVPYFDARNGPPNFLFHNEGAGVFEDRTETAGLNVDNDRFSFACCWGDANSDGSPDLYVVNDFGRNVLYRNNGDGTFKTVSEAAQVQEAGAGMSACWLDFDNDGKSDIYAAGMWVAPGMRIFGDTHFHSKAPKAVRALYRRHMMGNSLYRNFGDGRFENVAMKAGVDMGRWSWSTDAWDFDHDGYPDIYVANGYISGADGPDVSSFFWRQVVAKSPHDSSPSPDYERGWGAINELIRSDSTWNGHERNVMLANNRDGTFSDISGISGLDFRDDSRAFTLADLDRDGRLELVLKNRSAPQIRILKTAWKDVGNAIAIGLRGTKSNRDAIGAAVTIAGESGAQTKYVQAGSGFLSQHTKELHFGLGKTQGVVSASVRWPSGLTQSFEGLPVNHHVEIAEGSADFTAKAFRAAPKAWTLPGENAAAEVLPSSAQTWLIDPVKAPEFSLPDLSGAVTSLQSLRGNFVLLNFWTSSSEACREQLRNLVQTHSAAGGQMRILSVNFDTSPDVAAIKSLANRERIAYPVLLATPEVAGVYNLLYRYLFDRRRDLPLPASLLLDETGAVVKVYQGLVTKEQLVQDRNSVPRTEADRLRTALPFPGKLCQDEFRRNDFTHAVAFFQHGYLDQAAESFRQVIAARPNLSEAYYNLGTLYLRRNSLADARANLEQAVKLRASYPEAWNNLGMLSAQEGKTDEALQDLRQALRLRPEYATALINLGNLLRRQRSFDEAEKLLARALDLAPGDAEASYSMGMLYGQQDQLSRATEYLQRALVLRPDYPDARNNLGVVLVRAKQYSEAEAQFKTCIEASPDYDQAYLNLARLYVMLNDKEEARKALQDLLRRQPGHPMARQALEMLQ